MAILHLIRTSPSKSDNLTLCLELLTPEDSIVLIDDGCYCLTQANLKKLNKKQLYILEEHALARGINVNDVINTITFQDLLALIARKTKTITWQ